MPSRATAAQRAAKAQKAAIRRSLIAEQARIKAEATAEEQAPLAQRQIIVAPDGSIIREPTAIRARHGGFRRANVLGRMHRNAPNQITTEHIRCADRFSVDYEIGVMGGMPPSGVQERVDGSGGRIGLPQSQAEALSRYRAACDALGPSLCTPVQFAALHDMPLAQIARSCGMDERRCTGYITAGLDRLVDHYHPNRVDRFDAARQLIDPSVTDIPQERLGRPRIRA